MTKSQRNKIVDFHSHILPEMDDGSKSWEESLTMAGLAVAYGVSEMVATPHFDAQYYRKNTPDNILKKVNQFKDILQKNHLPLKIYPGAEYMLTADLPELLKDGHLMTVNNCGKHLLVELPKLEVPIYTEDVLFQILLQKVTPVLAHPERNLAIIEDPGILINLVQRGVMMQITAGSLDGSYGRASQKTVKTMLKEGLVHLIGSDMHSARDDLAVLKEAEKLITKVVKKDKAGLIVMANAQPIIQGL